MRVEVIDNIFVSDAPDGAIIDIDIVFEGAPGLMQLRIGHENLAEWLRVCDGVAEEASAMRGGVTLQRAVTISVECPFAPDDEKQFVFAGADLTRLRKALEAVAGQSPT